MLRSVRLRIYVYAHLNVRYIDYLILCVWQAGCSFKIFSGKPNTILALNILDSDQVMLITDDKRLL